MNAARVFVALIAAPAVAACDGYYNVAPEYVCPASYVPAIRLSVRDSTTGAAAARDAVVTWRVVSRFGTFDSPELKGLDTLTISVGSLPGTYDLTVRKTGYAAWTRDGIVVEPSEPTGCISKTLSLTALLRPAP